MHATRTHNIGGTQCDNNGKMRIISLAKEEEDNWRGKLYQQFQLHGTQYFTEMELNKYPFDYRDIMNCLCKFRREDKHLSKECEPFADTEYEFKQSEIDENDDSKDLWEEIDTNFSIMSDEKYFVIYIPGLDIIMYRVGKKCDFFAMNRDESFGDKVTCKIIPNYVVKQHIEDVEKKCKPDGYQYLPIIGFYIR